MKEPIDIEFTEQKFDPENDENAIDFKLSGVQELDIARLTCLKTYKSKPMIKIFQKKITWGLFEITVSN